MPAGDFTTVPPESLRVLARLAVAREDWMQAVAVWHRLEKLEPGNHEVEKKLQEARAHLQIAQMGVSRVEIGSSGQRFLLAGAALVGLLALPILSAFAFSTMGRARFHMRRGNYKRAAELYENVLLRHPHRLKVYPRLAIAYLRMGRQDEAALRIFKTVVQFNLPMPQRESLNALLANNYLAQGCADREAIEILETALREELRRQKQV